MQDIAHAHGSGVGQHDKSQIGRRLVVVHAVLAGTVADEGIVFAAQLAHDVAQTEHGTEDELGVVGSTGDLFRGGPIGGSRCFAGGGRGRGGVGGWKPVLGVDALRWRGTTLVSMTRALEAIDARLSRTYCAGRICRRSRLSWWAVYYQQRVEGLR